MAVEETSIEVESVGITSTKGDTVRSAGFAMGGSFEAATKIGAHANLGEGFFPVSFHLETSNVWMSRIRGLRLGSLTLTPVTGWTR